MTLSDLKALQPSKHWKYFIFLVENQPQPRPADNIYYNLTFLSMEVANAPLMPPAVYLFNVGNCIGFTDITAVECAPHILGDIITLQNKSGRKYTIIAQ